MSTSERTLDPGTPRPCRYCGAAIFYAIDEATGKLVPVDAAAVALWVYTQPPGRRDPAEPRVRRTIGHAAHMATCPEAHRAVKRVEVPCVNCDGKGTTATGRTCSVCQGSRSAARYAKGQKAASPGSSAAPSAGNHTTN